MKKIAIISDTHSFFDLKMTKWITDCDEIWHAGDFGYSADIKNFISNYKIRGVYGNIDGQEIRKIYPKTQTFNCEKIKVLMTHIGGYPKKYNPEIKKRIQTYKPDLLICGHSHILKVIYDNQYKLLHINPGAAGKEGFHKMRTIVLLKINAGKIFDLQVVELGKRSTLSNPIN
tara:strand:- start:336 stop:854 length:519 start_codon:yes stop_codon:yes gene_type:complete